MQAFLALSLFLSLVSTAFAYPTPGSASIFASSGRPTFCTRYSAQCNVTCAATAPGVAAVSTCNVNISILKRASVGALQCMCGTTDATAAVASALFKPMMSSDASAVDATTVTPLASSTDSLSNLSGQQLAATPSDEDLDLIGTETSDTAALPIESLPAVDENTSTLSTLPVDIPAVASDVQL
ncbi:unnamed protein product [Parajaminaea phylloscopi]